MDVWLIGGVIALGVVHGVLPDHGWPIAATYALERPRKLVSGTLAALVIGVGHLFSSIVLVVAYYAFSSFAAFAEGPWMGVVAGGLLILLGIYEYYQFRQHRGTDERTHHDHANHDQQSVSNTGTATSNTVATQTAADGVNRGNQLVEENHREEHSHVHQHHHEDHGQSDHHGHQHLTEEHARQGLQSLGVTALILGFAHEEPIQILAICAGTDACLELMLVYSLAVIVAILIPTLLLIVGYKRHQERIERYTPYLPLVTAMVLVTVGAGFIISAL